MPNMEEEAVALEPGHLDSKSKLTHSETKLLLPLSMRWKSPLRCPASTVGWVSDPWSLRLGAGLVKYDEEFGCWLEGTSPAVPVLHCCDVCPEHCPTVFRKTWGYVTWISEKGYTDEKPSCGQ